MCGINVAAFRTRWGLGLGDLCVEFLEQDVQLGFVEERQLVLGDPIRLGSEALMPEQFQALQQKLDLAVALLDGFVPIAADSP